MLYIKSTHIIFMVAWFAGLFYLPRLFVYHAMSKDKISLERFKVMERKLYYGIATPSMILTIFTGIWMLKLYAWEAFKEDMWLHTKFMCVFFLIIYHIVCGYYLYKFKKNHNTKSHIYYRIFNEIPVFFLVAIVILVVVKPF